MRVVLTAAATLAAVLTPSTAMASGGNKQQSNGQNGVHVDPGSPSAHQYVIPVNAARHEAAGGKGSSAPLFGNGVTPSSTSSTSTTSTTPSHAAHRKSYKAAAAKRPVNATYAPAASVGRPPSGPSSSSGGGGSGWAPLVGGGALVLLLGGGGGLALRRRVLRT